MAAATGKRVRHRLGLFVISGYIARLECKVGVTETNPADECMLYL